MIENIDLIDFAKFAGSRSSQPLDGWFFTAGRMRLPNARGTVAASEEFTAHKSMWISDDLEQNEFYIALWNGYIDNTGEEKVDVTPFDLAGSAMHAFYSSAWHTKIFNSVALANPIAFAAAHMQIVGPFVFDDWVPNESQMAQILRINTTAGAFLPTNIKLRNGTNEGASRTIATSDFHLTATGALGGTDGRFDGELMCPSFIIAKPRTLMSRPVFLGDGDSILWGKNSNENNLPGTTTGAMGAFSIAMESKSGKRRYPFANFGCPGMGPDDSRVYRDDLIKLCPNRPFTDILINDLNNIGGTAQQITDAVSEKALHLKELSTYWGDPEATVLHLGVLPKPGTTDWCTTLENQGSSGINYPGSARFGFETNLLAGLVPGVDGYIKNERLKYDLGDNRDRWKLTDFSTTVAVNYTQNATSIQLTDNPGIGAMIVVEPGGTANAARHVTGVSGTGPFVCTIESGINVAGINATDPVKTTLAGDNGSTGGTHPASPGHVLWSLDIIEDLAARYEEV